MPWSCPEWVPSGIAPATCVHPAFGIPLLEWLRADRPYLGICLGYQLLFESSEESPEAKGLGFLPGRVGRFEAKGLKVPHMGWNTLSGSEGSALSTAAEESSRSILFTPIIPVPADGDLVSAFCEYGETFAASISAGSIHATQFHPEKSQKGRLAICCGIFSPACGRKEFPDFDFSL